MTLTSKSSDFSHVSEARTQELLARRHAYGRFLRQAAQSSQMRHLARNNHAYRHVMRCVLNFAMFVGFASLAREAFHVHPLLGISSYPIYVFFQALVISGLMIHSHEMSHGHIRIRWLNDLLGVACGLPSFTNFYSFRYAHRFHHKNIGNLDAPEAGAPVSPAGQKRLAFGDRPRKFMRKVGAVSPLLWFVSAWPVFVVVGDYCSWLLPYRGRQGVDRKSLAVFALFALVNAWALLTAPYAYLLLFLVPMTLGGNRILALTYLHHAHKDSVFFSEEFHSPASAIMFSTDRDYGALIDFFMLNNGYHIAHHVLPSIAYYDLKRASRHLRATIPAELPYNFLPKSSLYRDFALGQYNARLIEPHRVFQITPEPLLHSRNFKQNCAAGQP